MHKQSAAHQPQRRKAILLALSAAGLCSIRSDTPHAVSAFLISNVTQLYSVTVAKIEQPKNAHDVARALTNWPHKVAIGGARYSMGGQIAIHNGLHLDVRAMNQLIWFKPHEKIVRVQAGMTWRDLQDIIDPYNLSVHTMQSYANFTIGGSVSVNAHGRYIGHGSVAHSVLALQVVLANGELIEASRERNATVFKSAIGGYGAMGVITEVELMLKDNVKIARDVDFLTLDTYLEFFNTHIKNSTTAILHNADLAPPEFDRPTAVTWHQTNDELTTTERLVARDLDYPLEQNMIFVLTESPAVSAEKIRTKIVEPKTLKGDIVQWLNHEASLDAKSLEPRTRAISTYVLQEYFVPTRHFLSFVQGMIQIIQKYDANVLNISIRHSPADTVSALPWAVEEVFCFVLFYKQRTLSWSKSHVGEWTRALIDLALQHQGRYYLPYQLHATQTQFENAYPEIVSFRTIKKQLDPQGKLSNQLWDQYL